MSPEINISINVELYCARCGAGICRNGYVRRGETTIEIEPCAKCLADERDKGYEEGANE